MENKINEARVRVRKMERQLTRLENKYQETKDILYKEMAESTSRDIDNTIIAIVDAERKLKDINKKG